MDIEQYISEGTPERIRSRYRSLPSLAEASDFGDLDRNIVVIDTETTGFSFNHDELTQIAAARMESGKIVDWYVTFVNPGKPIPDDVAHLTNIHDEDVADAPSPNEALEKLAAFVGDAKVVAHNVGFDRTFTTKHPGGYPLLENVWIDSLDLARIALPRMKSHRLIDLVKAFGAPVSTHRADDDVAATCALFRILLAAVAAMPRPLVREIARLAPSAQWPTSVVFEHFANEGNVGEGCEPAAEERSFSLRETRHEAVGGAVCSQRPASAGGTAPSAEEVAAVFADGGILSELYDVYEQRTEQTTMAEAVRTAFEESESVVVEAGTGVGKSMAYLVPSVLLAKKTGAVVGVATKTNALLDQLMFHELPLLAEAFGPLQYAALKGFSHYPCLRKVENLLREGPRLVDDKSQAPALAGLLSFVEQTDYDDLDRLKIDFKLLPRRAVTTTSHDCLRRKCPFFGTSCFVHGARRRAESADIVVTNHSLLFCDAVADGGLLPPVKHWVLDEAHGAEAEARRAFSLEIAAEDLTRLCQKVSAQESVRNVFVKAERRVERVLARGASLPLADDVSRETSQQPAPLEEGSTLFYALSNKAKAAGRAFAETALDFSAHMKDLLFFDGNRRGKSYDRVELWLNDDIRSSETFSQLAVRGRLMEDAAEKLVSACQDIVAYLEGVDGLAEPQREIASVAMELKELLNSAEVILHSRSEKYAYAANLTRKTDRPADKLQALLVNVGEALQEKLYDKAASVVFTSATLTVGGSFSSYKDAMGLAPAVKTLELDSCYDYDANMTVYVVSDMPEPSDAGYLPALQQFLAEVHLAQEGSMLTLFTNRREMERCFDEVQPVLKQNDLRLVCQKWGVSVKGLRDDFLADEHLSLFALKSFWEGFDAPGATLKGVIIPKLPFSKPTDPLSCERAARDSQAWRRYVLPAAVMETKQAAGRLIRKATDTGVLVLTDKRLITKQYGSAFLKSLPSRTIEVLPAADVVEAVRSRSR